MIGSDLVGQINKWYRIEELLKQIIILVIPRPNYPIKLAELSHLKHQGGNYVIADLNGLPVSSTAYRNLQDETVITASVYDYIQDHELYRMENKELRMENPRM